VIDLNNPNLSFILLSSNKIDDLISVLYTKDFSVVPIKGYYRGNFEDSVIAYSDIDNNELRNQILILLNLFDQNCGFIKYLGQSEVTKISKDGTEREMSVTLYNTDDENMSYLFNGTSFSFVEKVRYWKPTKLDDFKSGMIVEYFNGNRWNQKIVINPVQDWKDSLMLLCKYDKLRVVKDN
jgi:hypothetical protein